MDVFREFREHMEKYLRNARIDKSRVHDDVVLVGGFIRFPRVHSRHLHKKRGAFRTFKDQVKISPINTVFCEQLCQNRPDSAKSPPPPPLGNTLIGMKFRTMACASMSQISDLFLGIFLGSVVLSCGIFFWILDSKVLKEFW